MRLQLILEQEWCQITLLCIGTVQCNPSNRGEQGKKWREGSPQREGSKGVAVDGEDALALPEKDASELPAAVVGQNPRRGPNPS
jgi:predicted alternative tryptophan synthase beta-subunit